MYQKIRRTQKTTHTNCYAGDAFLSRCHKGHFPDKTIHWPTIDSNVEPPSATLGKHHSNQNHLSSNHEYNREYIFLNTF